MNFTRSLLIAGIAGLSLGTVPSHALSFGAGAIGGLNLANAKISGHSNTDYRNGLALGVRTEFGVTSPLSLLVEPMYLQKGALFDYNGGPFGDIKARGELDYIEVPVLLKAKFGALKAHAFVFGGPSVGFNVGAKGSIGSFSDDYKNQAESVVFSGDIGAGGAFQVQQYVYLTADARYSYGFTNSLKKQVGDIDSWKSRDILMLVGVLIHLTQ